jgi:hypothetical protein
MRYLGTVTITPGTPIKLSTQFPNEKGRPFNSLVVAQKRSNAGFVFVGTAAMTGEANASLTIPPASASAVPYANINLSAASDPLTVDLFAIDGTAAEVVQISTLTN